MVVLAGGMQSIACEPELISSCSSGDLWLQQSRDPGELQGWAGPWGQLRTRSPPGTLIAQGGACPPSTAAPGMSCKAGWVNPQPPKVSCQPRSPCAQGQSEQVLAGCEGHLMDL